MHTLTEKHQDGQGGRATVSPGPSDRPYDYDRYREHLNAWVYCHQGGYNPVEYFEAWKVRAYRTP